MRVTEIEQGDVPAIVRAADARAVIGTRHVEVERGHRAGNVRGVPRPGIPPTGGKRQKHGGGGKALETSLPRGIAWGRAMAL